MEFNTPENALFIKLGDAGRWEKESFEKGILRFGYSETPYEEAIAGNWDSIHKIWKDIRSGWRRVSELGKTQKTIDLDLILPTTGERAFVQIKSKTNKQEWFLMQVCLRG